MKDLVPGSLILTGALAMILFVVAFMTGCFLLPAEGSIELSAWSPAAPTYTKDSRTGLCFASLRSGGYTNVPCTDEVKHLID